jgi:hypothetical protein
MRPQGVRHEKSKLFLGEANNIIREILIQRLFTGHTIPKYPFLGENYARSSWIFESGFTGLTITSLD